ncbi:kinase-like protein [Karstenula rhodostoma CBS 690.94]|uniref:Kinase-like protein n=1 Tax=Karstenula rhodostoma CBS 690.94 TaxID=1392251 RepID=A0A9P4PQG2_9PLEO|nr:kinase-like protein [Karstenula rhodostoma CBS 690.94]
MHPEMPPQNQPQSIPAQNFRNFFKFVQEIGQGTEGIVSRWENLTTGQVVALKVPRSPDRSKDLLAEIEALKKVPPHENIATLLTYLLQHQPVGPALVFELAEYGDVSSYRRRIMQSYTRVPEITLWKFLRDMSLALDWLHNKMVESHIHGDLKPENILVFSPVGWKGEGVPTLPTFKIGDIARMQPANAHRKYNGTYEFGPPRTERQRKQTPAVDVWAIGASLQNFALGVLPVMNKADFIKEKKEQGGAVPTLADLQTEAWRDIIPHQYRPLNADVEFQRDMMKMQRPVPPYSFDLNRWYDQLVEEETTKRISSRTLAKRFVPYADVKIQTMIREHEHKLAMLRYDEAQAAQNARPLWQY